MDGHVGVGGSLLYVVVSRLANAVMLCLVL